MLCLKFWRNLIYDLLATLATHLASYRCDVGFNECARHIRFPLKRNPNISKMEREEGSFFGYCNFSSSGENKKKKKPQKANTQQRSSERKERNVNDITFFIESITT